jgi:hypothetical protein
VLQLQATPTPTIDYVTENLIGLAAGGEYLIDGGALITATGGEIPIDESWMNGASYTLVRKGDGTTVWDSAAGNITIPARLGAPTVTAVDETATGNDGKITGVSTLMAWSADGGVSWTDCTGTEVTGLAPGNYQVRLKAVVGSAFASAATGVTINAFARLFGVSVPVLPLPLLVVLAGMVGWIGVRRFGAQ